MPIYEVQYTEQLCKDMTATLATLMNFVQQLLKLYRIATKSHSNKGNNTKLNNRIWKLKEENVHFNIKWNTIKTCGMWLNRCNLCSS